MSQYKSLVLFILITALGACESTNKKQNKPSPRVKSVAKIESPRNGVRKTIGDTLSFKITSSNTEIKIDSVLVSNNGKSVLNDQLIWDTSKEMPGKQDLTVSVYLSNGTVEKKRHSVTLLSDIEPIRYTYRITNTFVHDPDAFTEGLFMYNNELYESTGEKGQSTLRRVDLKTGKIQKSVNLSSQYFGEGIALMNDNIYMLSYKERTGFVFNKNSFEQIRQFSYPTEGWGMTSNDNALIMSDGTFIIRFMEPENFSEIKQIKVYDQNGPIDYLNELEYVNGNLFAVRWQTEQIYIIDPDSGKVKGILDLEGIFDYSNYDRRIDVLNGIAYNKNIDRYYVTGKWWPKLFEIQLVAANNI
ncbi:Glutamine cyclotransferase [Reichenbachiella faecimaris]|uniref:Glutamine cyclotransferase n=1 Tax=Reichenbachiella faecimaris TaxID=692418 RepID=A0A1W2G677_REIFA|nr:glutaminyl-peptide cyclotransferase [Reichenbachiella faecimaris]SMD32113.1 Glutamine cyclotransferase [Reichenbachiella faecimaris]